LKRESDGARQDLYKKRPTALGSDIFHQGLKREKKIYAFGPVGEFGLQPTTSLLCSRTAGSTPPWSWIAGGGKKRNKLY